MSELRVAAERLRRHRDSGDMRYADSDRAATDLMILAFAWLDEHPADDDLPIDEAWLRSVGAKKDDHPNKWTFHRVDALAVGLWIVDDGWKAMLLYTNYASSCIRRGLKTRGDLIRLCSALGIELKAIP